MNSSANQPRDAIADISRLCSALAVRQAARPMRGQRRFARGVLVLFLAWASMAGAAVSADELRCTRCGILISGRYVAAGGKSYCSDRCYRESLPRCAVCGRAMEGSAWKHEGKLYCSEACFTSTLPACELCGARAQQYVRIGAHVYCERDAQRERCCACRLPFVKGKWLPDGRSLCDACRPGAIVTYAQAEPLFAQALTAVTNVTGLSPVKVPQLVLAGTNGMSGVAAADGEGGVMRESGEYARTVLSTRMENTYGTVIREHEAVTEVIRILYGLPRDRFIMTAAHESMHDLLADRFPGSELAPAWLVEGTCQYVAASVCRALECPAAIAEIESFRDNVYGDGYRALVSRFGSDNVPALVRYLKHIDFARVPREAPQSP